MDKKWLTQCSAEVTTVSLLPIALHSIDNYWQKTFELQKALLLILISTFLLSTTTHGAGLIANFLQVLLLYIFITFNHCLTGVKAFCSQSLWQSLSIFVSLLTKSIKDDPFSRFPKMIRVFLFLPVWVCYFVFSKNDTMP